MKIYKGKIGTNNAELKLILEISKVDISQKGNI